jgi:hypothetical protein
VQRSNNETQERAWKGATWAAMQHPKQKAQRENRLEDTVTSKRSDLKSIPGRRLSASRRCPSASCSRRLSELNRDDAFAIPYSWIVQNKGNLNMTDRASAPIGT